MHHLRLHNTGCKTQEDFVELRSYLEKNQRKTNKKAGLQRIFVGDRIRHYGEEDA